MAGATSLVELGFAARDLVRCALCGSPVRYSGGQFSCPRNGGSDGEACPTLPQAGDILLRGVMNCLIGRLMNDSVTRELVAAVEREIALVFPGPTGGAGETGGLAGAGPPEPEGEPAQPGVPRYDEEISQRPGLFHGRVPEPEEAVLSAMDLAFLRDPEGLEDAAQDPGTYLEHATPAQTRHFLGLFIEEIHLGPHSVEIQYLHPLPDAGNRASVTSDRIELPFGELPGG